MPYDDPDPTDPSMLVGVMLPGVADATGAMAEVFADEFARLGYGEREIFALFEDPFYAGAHAALSALGAPAVLTIIQEAVTRWPAVRIVDAPREARPSGGMPEAREFTSRADAHRSTRAERAAHGGELHKET